MAEANDPVQFNVCVAKASILYNIVADVIAVEPALFKVILGVTLLLQFEEPLTGEIIFKILASKAVTGEQPLEDAKIFHGAVFTTASIRAT